MSDTLPHNESDDQATENAAVQVDLYGVKAKGSPKDVEEVEPRDWKEVGTRVNALLRKIAVGLVTFVDEAITGARRGVKGLTSVPGALAKRIEGAHRQGDQEEEHRQNQLANREIAVPDTQHAVDHLASILERHQANGYHVRIVLKDGKPVIVVVRPEHGELAAELGKNALLSFDPDEGESGEPEE